MAGFSGSTPTQRPRVTMKVRKHIPSMDHLALFMLDEFEGEDFDEKNLAIHFNRFGTQIRILYIDFCD